MANAPVAVITGGSRGLGFEAARQLGERGYHIAIASKDAKRLEEAAHRLGASGATVEFHLLDQGNAESIATFAKWAGDRLGTIDALINCAGVSLEGDEPGTDVSVLGAGEKDVLDTIDINAIGPWRLTRTLVPLLARNARIVNVSSGMGAIGDMGSGYFGYRASKAALNVLTRSLAPELKSRGIMINSVCPGWVKTDMGGPNATRSVEQGASGIVWAATLPPGGPTNGFFRDGRPIAW
jgi:NAD(P)-dependent dehydrogenase (short-subunit alcohol dehydrogenase family)